jgi:hypothetical protein
MIMTYIKIHINTDSEVDTCQKKVLPMYANGWMDYLIPEQWTFTDSKFVVGRKIKTLTKF